MEPRQDSRRRRVADAMGIAAVAIAAWAPLALVLDAPLALAAGFGGLAMSTGAGRVDPHNGRAPTAFLCTVAIGVLALIVSWIRS